MTGGRDATLKAGRGVKDQLKTAVKKSAMMLSILAYKHLRIIFYFASSVPAVAFSSLAAIPFQAILGELRDIFSGLDAGAWTSQKWPPSCKMQILVANYKLLQNIIQTLS